MYNEIMTEEVLEESKVYDKHGNYVGKCVKITDDEGNVTIKVPILTMNSEMKTGVKDNG